MQLLNPFLLQTNSLHILNSINKLLLKVYLQSLCGKNLLFLRYQTGMILKIQKLSTQKRLGAALVLEVHYRASGDHNICGRTN